MSSKYWRTVDVKNYFDDYHGELSIYSFQCLNCKVEWECDKSPEAFKLCPFCETRWKGEFTRKNKRWQIPKKKFPAFVIQHLKGRPYDNLKDRWEDYSEEHFFLDDVSNWVKRLINNCYNMIKLRYGTYDIKAMRLIIRYPDDSIKVLKEYTV